MDKEKENNAKSSEKDKKIIEDALERFKLAQNAEADFRKQAKDDLDFVSNDQWEPLARQQRTEASRPCFTVDRINPALRQIVNEERQNRPSVQVDPTSGDATVEVANVYAGLIRNIEQDSNAEAHYDEAGWYAAACGQGWLRVKPVYENHDSFDQKLIIESIPDPMCVFVDPHATQPDGSDAEWAFIVDTLSQDEFRRHYPDSKMLADMQQMPGGWSEWVETSGNEWIDQDSIKVAEYFYKDYVPATLYQILDNNSQEIFETTEKPPQNLLDDNSLIILRQRKTHKVEIKWLKMTCDEILSETKFEGNEIPVVPVYGERYFVNGKMFKCGAVYRAKDAQKILNFATSQEIEILDLNAKAPYIGAAGAFDTFEDRWSNANRKNYAYLEYNSVDIAGNPVPPPQRNAVEAPIQAAQSSKMAAAEDIRSIFGVIDIGAEDPRRSEVSGAAILARKQQTGVSNYHYYDNLVRAVKRIGRILVNAIPKYYDTARTVRIIKPDGDQELVAINQVTKNGKIIDLRSGRYDIVVQTGPSYATRRQEMVTSGISLVQAYPDSAPLIADLIVQEMDFPGAKAMSQRLKAAVPPAILEATNEGNSEDAEVLVPQLQSKVQALTQQLEQMQAQEALIKMELKKFHDEFVLEKMKSDLEVIKAQQDHDIEAAKLGLEAEKTKLQFMVKEQELKLNEAKLQLEREKIEIAKVQTAASINDAVHDRATAHFDKIDTAIAELSGEDGIENMTGMGDNTLE